MIRNLILENGIEYDVSFHMDKSFAELWGDIDEFTGEIDPTGPVILGAGATPLFWVDETKMDFLEDTAHVIMGALGETDQTSNMSDLFFIPVAPWATCGAGGDLAEYCAVQGDGDWPADIDVPIVVTGYEYPVGLGIVVARDDSELPTEDNPGPLVSFSRSSTIPVPQVPIPPAIWLFGSAIAGFGFFARKRTNQKAG